MGPKLLAFATPNTIDPLGESPTIGIIPHGIRCVQDDIQRHDFWGQFMSSFRFVAVLGVTLLGGCSGGGGGSSGQANSFCRAIARPNSSVICNGCSGLSNSPAVFDGNLDTFAALAGGGHASIEGNNSPQPAGEVAGVYFNRPASDSNSYTLTITTFLNGTQQETGVAPCQLLAGSNSCGGYQFSGSDGGGPWFVGLPTTKAFDAIQAAFTTTGTQSVNINELCVR